ncbi:MAG: hypothetical protein ACLFUW_08850, partial [Bacteroidales bacterium]
MKRILIIAILILAGTSVFGQGYKTSIGVRGAFASGITAKHFIEENVALEGILSGGAWGGNITGLYEIHTPAFDVERLYWYYGGGAHIAQWNEDFYFPSSDRDGSHIVIGLDGILGLEYYIEEIPFTISADWKPIFNITGYPGFSGYGGAISIRYTF